jgi:hypothetical protein
MCQAEESKDSVVAIDDPVLRPDRILLTGTYCQPDSLSPLCPAGRFSVGSSHQDHDFRIWFGLKGWIHSRLGGVL